jgi:bifunctional UDP-N-acetylglucosamine pyrophosphorylase/glucosamine-1-phosphate N-acetyltransferase
MIDHVLRAVQTAGVERIYVVTGHKGELVEQHIDGRATCVEQAERLGTGHAVLMTADALADFDGNVVVTYGDMPLIKTETYARLIEHQAAWNCAAVMLTANLTPARGYGRIVRDAEGKFEKVVEEKDCTREQKAITEVNTGLYVFDSKLLFAALAQVRNENAQSEYYLTDVPGILRAEGHRVDIVTTDDEIEILGVNSREQLADVGLQLRWRLLKNWMDEGVTIIDPQTTNIESTVVLRHDCVIEPGCVMRGATQVGERAIIGPNTELINAEIGEGAQVRHSVVENAAVAAGAVVGPFAHVK